MLFWKYFRVPYHWDSSPILIQFLFLVGAVLTSLSLCVLGSIFCAPELEQSGCSVTGWRNLNDLENRKPGQCTSTYMCAC